ncbi:Structural maintenance of chromosomes protein 6 [Orchesella cincta]|uniref:Structural maintenance of chromosomes protein 6 n=1 Tax=Orchesella cincta TaxID=48709 RepID=A0A1D2NFV7_ORCCI|nr:Structural maintenance of chromosomes protein 6 [Orchesella cincta]
MDQARERIKSCISALPPLKSVKVYAEIKEEVVEEPTKPKERCFSLSVVELSWNETTSSSSESEEDDVFENSKGDTLDNSHSVSGTIVNLTEDTITGPENQETISTSSDLSISYECLDNEWDLLEAEKEALWVLHKRIKKQKTNVVKSRSAFESKIVEICQLQAELKGRIKERVEMKLKIKTCKEAIEKLKSDKQEAKRITENLHQTKEKAETELVEAQAKYDLLRVDEDKYSDRFEHYGKKVKASVEERTTLYRNIDSLNMQLVDLEVADDETGIKHLDASDPLQRIESEYAFYPNVDNCTPENIGNAENPKKCVEAMENFTMIIRANIHRFKHLPMGPLFKCLKIQRKRFSHLIEHVLRPYLFTFLVDNIVDGLVMEELIAKHFEGTGNGGSVDSHGVVRPKYFVYDFNTQYQIGSRISLAMELDLENLFDAVHFDDVVWGMFLSQKIQIEKIIFMENESLGFMLMSNLKRNPEECNLVYTLDGFTIDPFPCFRTKRIQLYPYTVYLECFPDPKIEQVRTKIKQEQIKIGNLDAEIYIHRQIQMEVAEELDKIRSEMSKLHVEATKYHKEKKDAEAQLKKGISAANEQKVLKLLRTSLEQIKEGIMLSKLMKNFRSWK